MSLPFTSSDVDRERRRPRARATGRGRDASSPSDDASTGAAGSARRVKPTARRMRVHPPDAARGSGASSATVDALGDAWGAAPSAASGGGAGLVHRGEEGMPAHLATARAQAHWAPLVGFGSLTLREARWRRVVSDGGRAWGHLGRGAVGRERRRRRARAPWRGGDASSPSDGASTGASGSARRLRVPDAARGGDASSATLDALGDAWGAAPSAASGGGAGLVHRGEEGMPAHLATARAQAHRAPLVGFGSLTLREVAARR